MKNPKTIIAAIIITLLAGGILLYRNNTKSFYDYSEEEVRQITPQQLEKILKRTEEMERKQR